MNRTVALVASLSAIFFLLPSSTVATGIDTVLVGNPGNPEDPHFGGMASIPYLYRIGTYEVTNSQYVDFLNAKAASDPLGLYSPSMGSNARGGISQSGVPGSYSYTVKENMGNKPVNYVSYFDAVRFANWMNNGQGNGSTESGSYTLLGGTPVPSNAASVSRTSGATWYVPTDKEWYKAAYYDPRTAGQGGPTNNGHYWLYPTASDSFPATIATANSVGDISNPGGNVVNYKQGADWNGQDGNVTSVGSAGPSSRGFYGAWDLGGNVTEWTDPELVSMVRDLLGGSWAQADGGKKGDIGGVPAMNEYDLAGFRLVTMNLTVPEPSSFILAALSLMGFAVWGWRRKR